ncbi:hypothetical protein MY11210_009224 [Beauveria gryllotalpidicola]
MPNLALRLAVECDDVTALDILLEAGASPWETSGFSHPDISPMDAALQAGNSFLFQRLLRYTRLGDDQNSRKQYRSMLLKAASAGQAVIVEDILSYCPDGCVDWPADFKYFILRDAAAYWRVHVVRLALERFTFSTSYLNRALSIAITFPPDNLDTPYQGPRSLDYTHQQQVIHLLIDAGADPSCLDGIVTRLAIYIDLVGALKALLEHGVDPNGRGLDKKATALHHLGGPVYLNNGPERHLHETGIRMLLDHGASVLERDTDGNTPLHYAAFGSNVRIFSLLASKLPPDADASIVNLKNSSGETLLHWAAAGKKYDIVQCLLSAGANVNCANNNGWTPLLCAVAPSRAIYQSYAVAETANLLLEHAADPLVCSTEFWTPLHCVATHLDTEEDSLLTKLATDLIARGAPIAKGAAMLPVAAHYGRRSLKVDTLDVGCWGLRLDGYLSASHEVSRAAGVVKDATPLHWAAVYGAVGTAATLVAHGANLEVRDANGKRPIDLVTRSRRLNRYPQAQSRLLQVLAMGTTPLG